MIDEPEAVDQDAPPLPDDLQVEAAALLAEAEMVGVEQPEGAQVEVISTGEMLTGLFDITFNNVIAPRRGAHWKMSKDESKALGVAYGAVLDKHFPDLAAGPEVTAVLISIAVFGPRFATDAAAAKKPKPEQASKSASKPASDSDAIEVALANEAAVAKAAA